MANLLIVEMSPHSTGALQAMLEEFGHQVVGRVTQHHVTRAVLQGQPLDLVLIEAIDTGDSVPLRAIQMLCRRCQIPVVYLSPQDVAMGKPSPVYAAAMDQGFSMGPQALQTRIELALQPPPRVSLPPVAPVQSVIGLAVITTDCTGAITYMNGAAVSLTGWSWQPARGYSAAEIIWLQDARGQRLFPWRQVLTGQPLSDQMGWLRSRQGALWSVTWSAAAMVAPTGEPVGGILTVQNLTETRQLESIRQAQLRRHQRLQKQARQAQQLAEIVQEIRTSLDLEHILRRTADWMLDTFQASRCLIRLGSPEADTFFHTVQAARHSPLSDETMPIADNPLVQKVFAQTLPVCIEDVGATVSWLTSLQPYFQRAQIQALMATAIRLDSKVLGIICLHQCDRNRSWRQDEAQLLKQVADQLAVAAQQAALYQKLQRTNLELARLAHLDGLTQIANRRFFDDFLQQEHQRQGRNGRPLSLILCDVDHFKRFNDTYGHTAGDQCLRLIAQELERQIKRPSDLLARYGGEEFAIVLPETDHAGAVTVAKRLLDAIAHLAIPHPDASQTLQVTISLGLASTDASLSVETPAQLIEAADIALYQAKADGRNCYRG